MTPEGVGSLVLGKPFADKSKSSEGLYDRVEKNRIFDVSSDVYVTYYNVFKGDEPVASFLSDDAPHDGIYKLSVLTPRAMAPHGLHIGMSVVEALSLPGIKASYAEDMMDETDCGYLVSVIWGYDIRPDFGAGWLSISPSEPECFTPQARKKCRAVLECGSSPLTAADFTEDAVVSGIYLGD